MSTTIAQGLTCRDDEDPALALRVGDRLVEAAQPSKVYFSPARLEQESLYITQVVNGVVDALLEALKLSQFSSRDKASDQYLGALAAVVDASLYDEPVLALINHDAVPSPDTLAGIQVEDEAPIISGYCGN